MNPYELLTPREWCAETDVTVLDPDGWRVDGKDFDEPVTYQEFVERLWASTVRTGPKCEVFR